MNLAIAIQTASSAHLGQFDKGGHPYILHPLWVMHKVRHLGEDYMIVAVLHDVVEDSDYSLEDLINLGFSDRIIDALRLLTHSKNKSYMDYIIDLSPNKLAKAVKLRDLEHNSKITRLKGLREKDQIAYNYLKYGH